MEAARNAPRTVRRPHRVRQGLKLSRLTALIALGFMPGLSAVGATFSDQVTFSTSNQSLWGSSVGSGILYSPSLDLKWGTYAGNAASQLFSFNGITSLTDPVFGASLGRYGVSASFSSSGHLGLGYNASMRGGTPVASRNRRCRARGESSTRAARSSSAMRWLRGSGNGV